MVFSGFTFLFLFLPLAVLCSLPFRNITYRNAVLCLFSLVFYAWGEPVYILIMLLSILLNYAAGLLMERRPHQKKLILVLMLILNLGAIAYFKYADFILGNLNLLFSASLPLTRIVLPIGISFYTFQILSYVIDVYRGEYPAQKNLLSLATYISMFPQLVAGPIVRYGTVEKELRERRVTLSGFADGLARCAFGLAKKVLLANQMALAADCVFDHADSLPGMVYWIGAICYTLQIYFDFSGYSDMAIGMGKMFGFSFPENFRYPYIASSVTDFWRRWHISLSSWFREYVYIPLGGNRRGVPRQILNMCIVWLLTGLWHGASWNFVLWGAYYGLLLILEKHVLEKVLKRLPSFVRHLLTLLLVIVGWVIFRVEDTGRIFPVLGSMFSFSLKGTGAFLISESNLLSPLVLLAPAILCCFPWKDLVIQRFGEKSWLQAVRYILALMLWLLSVSMLLGESYNPFIYFRF